MKITNIIRDKEGGKVYFVTFEPRFIGKIFGLQKKVKKYKDLGETYMFGGGAVYCDENGYKLGNFNSIGQAIDRWRRKISFK